MPVNYGYGYLNPYPAIILILIVLQWFRVGGSDNSNDLTSNGGLFIITLFFLVYCNCVTEMARAIRISHLRARRGFFGRGFFGRRFLY